MSFKDFIQRTEERLDADRYPGADVKTIYINFNQNKNYVDGKEVKDWREALALYFLDRAIGMRNANKGSWLEKASIPEHTKVMCAKEEDFYIDEVEVVKVYLALCSLMNEKKSGYAYACMDNVDGYYDVRYFPDLESAMAHADWEEENTIGDIE